jgi:cyclophilin family peptidyl-prolyl cis-trans isomerase
MKLIRPAILFVCLFAGTAFCQAGTLAQFRTVFGDIEVELYDQDKPVTVQNFIRYVQSGAYQDEFAHRLIPGFVIQGGGFTVTNRGATNAQILPVPTFPPITNEFGVGRRFSNVFGTIAMAKLGGDTNSATSQWFFNLTNNASLDANDTNDLFVVFGHVIRGTNVLNVFNSFVNWFGYFSPPQDTNLVLQYYQAPFDNLPLLQPNTYDSNFVYLDITLLQLAVKPQPSGARLLTWDSPSGMTNILEYATNLPPVWSTLVQTNGTGAPIAILDPAVADRSRFYRVRVTY